VCACVYAQARLHLQCGQQVSRCSKTSLVLLPAASRVQAAAAAAAAAVVVLGNRTADKGEATGAAQPEDTIRETFNERKGMGSTGHV